VSRKRNRRRSAGLKVKADVAGSRGMVFVARLKTNRIVRILLKVGPHSFAGCCCSGGRGEQEPLAMPIDFLELYTDLI